MKLKLLLTGLLSIVAVQNNHASVGIQKASSPYVISNYSQTKYPIVMVHGAMGFSTLGTSAFGLDYWYQIMPDLARNGAVAYATQVSAVNTTEVRGEQLLQQVDEILAITGNPKVNLIGHSHGGPTARYIESVAPSKVASISSIAGPMKGLKLATIISNSSILDPVARIVFTALGGGINLLQGTDFPTDATAALYSYSEQGMQEFNQKFPSAAISSSCYGSGQQLTSNGVYHYSWTGNQRVTNIFDVADSTITSAGGILLASTDNDGIVERCSSNYGKVIRNDYRLNHFDEVNQVLGIKSFLAPDPVSLIRQHTNRLKVQGL